MMETFKTQDLAHAAYCVMRGLKMINKIPGKKVTVILEGQEASRVAAEYVNEASFHTFADCFVRVRDYALDPSIKQRR